MRFDLLLPATPNRTGRTGPSSQPGEGKGGDGAVWLSQGKLTLENLLPAYRRLKAEHNLHLVVVDYIQLMQGRGRFENRTLELASISRSLKGLAKELNVPIVVLSQLSRAPESRSDHRPQLSDLRESGALEQDADVVVFIYREDLYADKSQPSGEAQGVVGRSGQVRRGVDQRAVEIEHDGEVA